VQRSVGGSHEFLILTLLEFGLDLLFEEYLVLVFGGVSETVLFFGLGPGSLRAKT
jgi:hypothetical protein